MYYFIHNSEDGLRVDEFDTVAEAETHIGEIAGPDIDPEFRAFFAESVPDDYSSAEQYLILKGAPVIPQVIKTITEYSL